MSGKARIGVLVAVALIASSGALITNPELRHTLLRHERMPELENQFPVAVHQNPCGDGRDAVITVGVTAKGQRGAAFYLDANQKPWGISLKIDGETVAFIDWNRDGWVDFKGPTPQDSLCSMHTRVKPIGFPKKQAPVING